MQMRPIDVRTPDGLVISAAEWGNPAGAEIVFIHGFAQCSLSWTRQLADVDLGREFRMIAYDLRGHGASDKPADKDKYAPDRAWADELAAVIAAANLRRPVLVGWSYAGRVISDYLRLHGSARLAGINFVAAVTKSGSELLGPDIKDNISGMLSGDPATNIAATRAFVRACYLVPPNTDEFATLLAFNMSVPASVRAAVLDRPPNPGDVLRSLALPLLITHGTHDRIVLPAMAQFTTSAVPHAQLSLYDGIGHCPFFEDAPRFNRELAAFVRGANRST
jgi:pimeloyl-ACP methyl ester carboxylesterase